MGLVTGKGAAAKTASRLEEAASTARSAVQALDRAIAGKLETLARVTAEAGSGRAAGAEVVAGARASASKATSVVAEGVSQLARKVSASATPKLRQFAEGMAQMGGAMGLGMGGGGGHGLGKAFMKGWKKAAAYTPISHQLPPAKGYVSGFREIMGKARAAKAGNVQALGEIQAAKVLRAEGMNVHFQTPIGQRGPKTADLLVGGERGTGAGADVFDVLTPRTENPANVALGIASKNNQAPNIIVNIRNNPHLSMESLGGPKQLMQDVRDLIEPAGGVMKIKSIRIVAK